MAAHDYRTSRDGKSIRWSVKPTDRNKLLATGWGDGIVVGDCVIVSKGAADYCYRVDEIKYYPDTPAMWRATLRFMRRDNAPVEALRLLGMASA